MKVILIGCLRETNDLLEELTIVRYERCIFKADHSVKEVDNVLERQIID